MWRWERTWDSKDHVDQTKEEETKSLSSSRITVCDRVKEPWPVHTTEKVHRGAKAKAKVDFLEFSQDTNG